MSIIEIKIYNYSEQKCKQCGGRGKIEIYRSDWEDFDDIVCDKCSELD